MAVEQEKFSTCRVVSAEAKTSQKESHNKLCGILEVGGVKRWVCVEDGQMVIHASDCPTSNVYWRLALRRLHLQPSRPAGLAFSLTRFGDAHALTFFKVRNETDYTVWVKRIAAELMRQTPLDSIRFLDILGITGSLQRARSAESLTATSFTPTVQVNAQNVLQEAPCLRYRKRADLPDVVRDLPPCSRKSRMRKRDWLGIRERGRSAENLTELKDISVKQKKLFFESLSDQGNNPKQCGMSSTFCHFTSVPRAQSLVDLSTPLTFSVRDIARRFEESSLSSKGVQPKNYFNKSACQMSLRNSSILSSCNQKLFSVKEIKGKYLSNIR